MVHRNDVSDIECSASQAGCVVNNIAPDWTGLLTALEKELPKSVYLVQVRPDVKSQRIEITGVAREMDGALDTVERLS